MSTVLVRNGVFRNKPVQNAQFNLVKGITQGARGNFVTVQSNGHFGPNHDVVRIRVNSIEDIEFSDDHGATSATLANPRHIAETDEQTMERIGRRFQILEDMTKAATGGEIRAMIVTGPPGVGKSFGVERQLEKAGLFNQIAGKRITYDIVKGAMTPIGLYCKLYNFSDSNNVLVLDDVDSVMFDDIALNVLKAALDSGKRRRIHWNSDSAMLRREGVPDNFDFRGSVIFITNLNFDNIKSKRLQDHLAALQSRCHFLDLTINTMREKLLRIKQIFNEGLLFTDYDLSDEQGDEILAFMDKNQHRLREMSLRMALKIADLVKISTNWRELAENTVMKAA